MAPAVLLLESALVSEACSPEASEAGTSGGLVPASPSGTRPPVDGSCGRAPEPPLPDGAECPGGEAPAFPSRASFKAFEAGPVADGGTSRDGVMPPEDEEGLLEVRGFGFGSRAGTATGRCWPESGIR